MELRNALLITINLLIYIIPEEIRIDSRFNLLNGAKSCPALINKKPVYLHKPIQSGYINKVSSTIYFIS